MIQSYLREEAEKVVPYLEWTYDQYTSDDNTGTVYYEGGPVGSKNDETDPRYPQYMFYIRSSNWDLAEYAVHTIRNHFHKQTNQTVSLEMAFPEMVTPPIKTFEVLLMEVIVEPIRVEVEDKVAVWSVNFQVTLREEK